MYIYLVDGTRWRTLGQCTNLLSRHRLMTRFHYLHRLFVKHRHFQRTRGYSKLSSHNFFMDLTIYFCNCGNLLLSFAEILSRQDVRGLKNVVVKTYNKMSVFRRVIWHVRYASRLQFHCHTTNSRPKWSRA